MAFSFVLLTQLKATIVTFSLTSTVTGTVLQYGKLYNTVWASVKFCRELSKTSFESGCVTVLYGLKGDGLEAPLSFKMMQWSCYCIGESVCYWLKKGNSMDTWRRRTHNTWRWRTTLIKSEHCYWMTASLYRKFNTVTVKVDNNVEQWLLQSFQTIPFY